MDMTSMIANMSSQLAAIRTQNSVSNAVLKKALEQQGAAILPLIAAATAANSPAHLGQNIDVYA